MTQPSVPQTSLAEDAPECGLRRPMWLGVLGAVALFGAVGGWAATTVIGGAVVASGQAVGKVVVEIAGGDQ